MKKSQKAIHLLLGVFIIVILAGAIFALLSPNSVSETMLDIIMLAISAGSIALAFIAQASANHSRRVSERIIRNIYDIDKNLDADAAVDRSIRYKLDKIMAQNEEIYEKLGGNIEEFRSKSSAAARGRHQEYRKEEENKKPSKIIAKK